MKKILASVTVTLTMILPTVSADKPSLSWPVDRPVQLSGSFAEFRGSRFHYGIDIGCDGKTGFRVFAAEKGSVAEVIYSNYGIGYCVVIRHAGGMTSLYGHLESFAPKILENPKMKKHLDEIADHVNFREKFSDGEIPVDKGELIAFTGRSGIGPEHLHFEICDVDDNPVNPLLAGLAVPDMEPPVIENIILVPLDGRSTINGKCERVEIPVKSEKGISAPDISAPVSIAGRIGVIIDAYDTCGGKSHIGIFRGAVSHNGLETQTIRFDHFSSAEGRHCGLFYDISFSTFSRYRYFLYNRSTGAGMVNVSRGGDSQIIAVTAADASGNAIRYEIPLIKDKEPSAALEDFSITAPAGKKFSLASPDARCSIEIRKDSTLYDERIRFTGKNPVEHTPRAIIPLSDSYRFEPADLCVTEPVAVEIPLAEKDSGRAGIYSITPSGLIRAESSYYDKKKKALIAQVWKLSAYFAAKDESAPKIRAPKTITVGEEFPVRAGDTGSGIDPSSAVIRIDGKKVKFYHDADTMSFMILPNNDIWESGTHTVRASVRDNAGNMSATAIFRYRIIRGKTTAKVSVPRGKGSNDKNG